jgi:cysteinyl-tRNA synthetase
LYSKENLRIYIYKEKKSYREIANFYENEFLNDLKCLNIDKPSIVLRVSDYMKQIIQFIEKLIEQKVAYVTPSGSVYFNKKIYPNSFFRKNQALDTEVEAEYSKRFLVSLY